MSRSKAMRCDDCGHRMKIGDYPFCPHGSVHRSSPFDAFDFEWDKDSPMAGKVERVSSMQQVRRIERETEKMSRDGQHRQIVFRDYARDKSNRDAPTLGRREFPKFSTRSKSGIPFVTRISDFTEGDD